MHIHLLFLIDIHANNAFFWFMYHYIHQISIFILYISKTKRNLYKSFFFFHNNLSNIPNIPKIHLLQTLLFSFTIDALDFKVGIQENFKSPSWISSFPRDPRTPFACFQDALHSSTCSRKFPSREILLLVNTTLLFKYLVGCECTSAN